MNGVIKALLQLLRQPGGLFCISSIIMLIGIGYGFFFCAISHPFTQYLPLITALFFILTLYPCVYMLRKVANELINTQQHVEQKEQAYYEEHRLNKTREQVLHTMNHELRTSLTQVQGYLELLDIYQSHLDTATKTRYIQQAQSGCEDILNLFTTLLDAAIGTDQPLYRKTFYVQEQVQNVLAQLDPRLLQTHPVQVDIPASLQVYADPGLMRRIVHNLLINAFKYTPDGTPITVNAIPQHPVNAPSESSETICVSISDEGPGIPPDQQTLVFQPFVRLTDARQSGKAGSGLGLAICKQLVEKMGGRIGVECNGKAEKGCRFFFTLPGVA